MHGNIILDQPTSPSTQCIRQNGVDYMICRKTGTPNKIPRMEYQVFANDWLINEFYSLMR